MNKLITLILLLSSIQTIIPQHDIENKDLEQIEKEYRKCIALCNNLYDDDDYCEDGGSAEEGFHVSEWYDGRNSQQKSYCRGCCEKKRQLLIASIKIQKKEEKSETISL